MNGRVFNLMLRVNETRLLVLHELLSKINESLCNSKPNQNQIGMMV